MLSKYDNIYFDSSDIKSDMRRLVNQIWKLLPMKENGEDWKKQANQVIVELIGLQEIFSNRIDLLIILSKLEGLIKLEDMPFVEYRSMVFSILSTLGEINDGII